MSIRKKIFDLVEAPDGGFQKSDPYDLTLMGIIILSLVPLAFKTETLFLRVLDKTTASIFIVDYLLRWSTADYLIGQGSKSFVLYPFRLMAIVDLVSILPSFTALAAGFKLVKLVRMFRALRVFRAVKMFRYSRSVSIILGVIRNQRAPLLAVCTLAVAYVLIAALVIFNVEPDTFTTFFDAIYWAAVSLTTMGYGDIYPVTTAGRIVTIVSSFVGIAIVALPSGIITAGYMDEIQKTGNEK